MSTVTAAVRVESVLRERILTGVLEPGSRLDQRGLARELGVSRLPVRDALMTLAAEGLVDTEPHRGTVVTEVDHEGLIELYELRMALEPAAASRGVPNLDGAAVRRMTDLVTTMEATTDPCGWRILNDEFHSVLLARSERSRTIEIVEAARVRCGAAWSFDSACMSAARTDHRLILRAAGRGDARGVRLLMEAHLALGHGRSVDLARVRTTPSVGLQSPSQGGSR